MTLQADVTADSKYRVVLDHGFVGLVDYMGSDNAVVQAARVSYGTGTKSVREDRGLIRYLMKHKHTSPFEMNQVKLHIKLPIFVMRQLVRHRTSSLNEYSGRYSVMTDEFYVPELHNIKPQSATNKQGRSGELTAVDAATARNLIQQAGAHNYAVYELLLGSEGNAEYDQGLADEMGLTAQFPGIAREIARTVLPVNNYTELYWTQNLHNLLHLLRLRMDSHAQYEIQVFANAIYDIIQPLYPLCCEAFEDYIRNARTVSGPEFELLHAVIDLSNDQLVNFKGAYTRLVEEHGGENHMMDAFRIGKREIGEFKSMWNL